MVLFLHPIFHHVTFLIAFVGHTLRISFCKTSLMTDRLHPKSREVAFFSAKHSDPSYNIHQKGQASCRDLQLCIQQVLLKKITKFSNIRGLLLIHALDYQHASYKNHILVLTVISRMICSVTIPEMEVRLTGQEFHRSFVLHF